MVSSPKTHGRITGHDTVWFELPKATKGKMTLIIPGKAFGVSGEQKTTIGYELKGL